MRLCSILVSLLLAADTMQAQSKKPSTIPMPNEFVVGVETYIDVGPPFEYLDIFLARAEPGHVSVERISLTPEADACFQPATVEARTGKIDGTIEHLLESKNPCAISKKTLNKKVKRCKNCLHFSGSNVLLQVNCGGEIRSIRSDILDSDMFDPNPRTPADVAGTMRLLAKFDGALGPGPLERPIFASLSQQDETPLAPGKNLSEGLESGRYDSLFPASQAKPSQIFRDSKVPPAIPHAGLSSSEPHSPLSYLEPTYPILAKAARIEEVVEFDLGIDTDGKVQEISVPGEGKKAFFKGSMTDAMSKWAFPRTDSSYRVHGSIRFSLNCRRNTKGR